jgi:hypothetical protein
VRLFPFPRRPPQTPDRPPSEQEVLRAGEEFARKERLVDRFGFLPPEVNRAAKDTAMNRFLDVLFSHLRW